MSSTPRKETLFPATMWSALREVGGADEAEVIRGLERLANAYWKPLYIFLLKRGYSHEKSADLVQGFFEYLLTGDVLQRAQPGEGRFRNYLLVIFRRWVDDDLRKEVAAKRGGGAYHFPLDDCQAAQEFQTGGDESPEEAFDRKWALALVGRALGSLAEDWSEKADLFRALKPSLDGCGREETYRAMAKRLGMTEGAVKTAAYALRKAFAAKVRQEIRATVATDDEVEDELRHLVRLLRG